MVFLQDGLQLLPILKVGDEKSIQIPTKHPLQNPNPLLILGIPELDMHPQRSNRLIPELPQTPTNLPVRVWHVLMEPREAIVLCPHEIIDFYVGPFKLASEIEFPFSRFFVLAFLCLDLFFEVSDGVLALGDASFPVLELGGETFRVVLFALTLAVIVFFFLLGLFLGLIVFDYTFFLGDIGF